MSPPVIAPELWDRFFDVLERFVLDIIRRTGPSRAAPDDRLLTTKEVLARVPVNRSTLWRMCREGRFPAPIQITPARLGWRQSTVVAWMQDGGKKRGKVEIEDRGIAKKNVEVPGRASMPPSARRRRQNR
jgi:prophage regulatory protein